MAKDYEKEKMLSYMRRKYKEEFHCVENYAGQAGKPYTMILVKSRRYGERRALVRISERNGKIYYEDNYLAYLLQEEIEKRIGALAGQCFGECRICYQIPQFVFPFYFKAEMGAEEFLGNSCSMAQFFICPENTSGDRQEWEKQMEAFRGLNAEKKYKIRGNLCIDGAELIFSMDDKGKFRYLRWLCKEAAGEVL